MAIFIRDGMLRAKENDLRDDGHESCGAGIRKEALLHELIAGDREDVHLRCDTRLGLN